MSGLTLEMLFVFLLILANGLFAMAEIAILSSRKVRLQQRANEGDLRARAALELAETPNRFLSTVQIGITLIGILAGAYGGATIAHELAAQLERISFLAPYSHAISLGVVVLGITYLSLILGELVPKRLALNSPERIACALATPMRLVAVLAFPAVRLLSLSTEVVLRLLGVQPTAEPPVTEEEIKILIEQGTQAGVFEAAEQDMVERVFRLGDRHVGVLMTPRTEIVWLDVEDSSEQIQSRITSTVHSRFLVAQGALDQVLGIVHAKDLLARSLEGQPFDLKACLRQPLFVPESMRALKVLELFKQSGTHLALVVDEYGGIEGLVTLNDILEAIVGDLPSIDEAAEPPVVQREDGSWLLDGMLPVDEVKELFQLAQLPEEETGTYQTLGGMVMSHLGRIPSAADHFEWAGLRFEVIDMDGHRVDKVLVAPVETSPSEVSNAS